MMTGTAKTGMEKYGEFKTADEVFAEMRKKIEKSSAEKAKKTDAETEKDSGRDKK